MRALIIGGLVLVACGAAPVGGSDSFRDEAVDGQPRLEVRVPDVQDVQDVQDETDRTDEAESYENVAAPVDVPDVPDVESREIAPLEAEPEPEPEPESGQLVPPAEPDPEPELVVIECVPDSSGPFDCDNCAANAAAGEVCEPLPPCSADVDRDCYYQGCEDAADCDDVEGTTCLPRFHPAGESDRDLVCRVELAGYGNRCEVTDDCEPSLFCKTIAVDIDGEVIAKCVTALEAAQ